MCSRARACVCVCALLGRRERNWESEKKVRLKEEIESTEEKGEGNRRASQLRQEDIPSVQEHATQDSAQVSECGTKVWGTEVN